MKSMFVLNLLFVSLCLLVLFFAWVKWMDCSKANLDRETVSSFECGFDGKDTSRLPFSLRFFLIVILFVIFDVEICVLLQMPFEITFGLFEKRLWYVLFVFVLGMGVLEEKRRGILSWK